MPTWSAVEEKPISVSFILTEEVSLAKSTMVLCLGAEKANNLVFSGASITWYLLQ